jgi:diguanylate cyclase (GGDEF)-like protein/PAS domain S-box-containing protein
VDKPWQFGIQQCSAERIWSDQELRLMEEIGHRLSDGLNSLLISRDLRESEARFRQVFENSPVPIQVEDYSSVKTLLESLRPHYGDDLAGYLTEHPEVVAECAALVRYVDINHAAMALHQAESLQDMQQGLPKIFVPGTMDDFRDIVLALMRGETSIRKESVLQTLHGHRYSIDAFFSVSPGYQASLERILVSLIDITELKQAELERQQHLHFLESLDRINRVLQEEGDIEHIMNKAMDAVLEIFGCDRAYLLYPGDPQSPTWTVPIERTVPEYPGVFELGVEIPMDDMVAWQMKTILESDHPVSGGPGNDYPVAEFLREQFNIRSFIAMALYPKADKVWRFGIQQCSFDRVWTDQEVRLMEEIGHRLSDGLNSLVISRNLRESEERFRLVYENSPISIWEEDFSAVKPRLEEIKTLAEGDLDAYLQANPELISECVSLVQIVNVNSATLQLHQAETKEVLFAGLPNTFIEESYDAFRKELVAIADGKTELKLDGAVKTLQGKRLEVSVSFAICPGYEETLSKVFVSMFDITQRKHDEDNLRLAASVFSTSQEGIMISDADNRIIDVNPAFTRLTGYSRDEAVGKNPRFLQSGRQGPEFYLEMWRALEQRGKWQGEVWNQRKSGEIYPELLSIVAVKDEQEQLQHYVGAFSDISSIKEHEAELARIAHYDVLTGLPNRRLLGDRLEQALAHARRTGRILAVCYLDLDGFKPINDRLGHEFGDQVLVEISSRLLSGSRGDDTVARLGGDEFVLLWNEIETQGDCVRMIERILQIVAEPIELQGESVTVSASIGVTQFPDDDVDADNLLRHADQAMYSAKQLGKNRYQMFDARLERQVVVRSEMLDRIRLGLLDDQFELYYQPKLNYATEQLDGVEALLRWNDPILGVLGAKEFLPPIEKDSLAYSVGQWVIERALNQARKWNDKGLTMPVSINLFPHHLNYRYFVRDLQQSVKSCWPEMPQHRLVMEIVESTNLEEIESIDQVIGQCREMGFEFSLDDFGTGYSSLIYLRRLSIEELKIDQSFVRDMLHDPDDEAIVRSVIGLGKAFGLRVVAEGVETREHARQLVELGCPIVQGYALGRPMSAEAFEKWYEDLVNNGLGGS